MGQAKRFIMDVAAEYTPEGCLLNEKHKTMWWITRDLKSKSNRGYNHYYYGGFKPICKYSKFNSSSILTKYR